MIDPMQMLLEQAAAATSAFPENSRYRYVGVATATLPDGRTVAYLRRRLVPHPEQMATADEHVVAETDRLDLIANRYLGDPEMFWRICDANRALRPDDLIDGPVRDGQPRRLRIGLPLGVPAQPRS